MKQPRKNSLIQNFTDGVLLVIFTICPPWVMAHSLKILDKTKIHYACIMID